VSRQIRVTAEQISAAAAVPARLRTQLAEWARTHATGEARQTLAALDARDQVLAKLSELDVQKLQTALDPPLDGYIRDIQQLVTRAGARLVVVILPIDVQVSAEEWKKYGVPPIDMEPSKALIPVADRAWKRLSLTRPRAEAWRTRISMTFRSGSLRGGW
jgi:hypothetical protein